MYSAKGLTAAHVPCDTTKEMKEGARRGEFQLVYITPELLLRSPVFAFWRVVHEHLVAFVIDKAHTVKKWYVLTVLILD